MLERVGDWKKVTKLISNLQKDLESAQSISLKRFSVKAEAIAVTHISKQDLNWKSLKASTISSKIRKGYSENILVASGLYFQSITGYVIKDTVYVGVKRNIKTKDGVSLTNIAEVHEFGSRSGRIPARPLWRPTMQEVLKWHIKNNDPVDIYLNRVKTRL